MTQEQFDKIWEYAVYWQIPFAEAERLDYLKREKSNSK